MRPEADSELEEESPLTLLKNYFRVHESVPKGSDELSGLGDVELPHAVGPNLSHVDGAAVGGHGHGVRSGHPLEHTSRVEPRQIVTFPRHSPPHSALLQIDMQSSLT